MITNISIFPGLIDHIVEFNQEASISKLLNNKKYLKRLKNETFNQIPFNVNLILIDCKLITNQSSVSSTTVSANIPAMTTLERTIKNSSLFEENSINLITKLTGFHTAYLSKNKTGSWIVCHKLGHGLYESQNLLSDFGKKNLVIKNTFERWMQSCYNKFHKTFHQTYDGELSGWDEVFKQMSPFKSAQQCIIRPDNQEYIYELVAQYTMLGRTSFLYPSKIFRNKEAANYHSKEIDKLIYQSLNNSIGQVIFGD